MDRIEALARAVAIATTRRNEAERSLSRARGELREAITGMRVPLVMGHLIIDKAPGGAPYVRVGSTLREG